MGRNIRLFEKWMNIFNKNVISLILGAEINVSGVTIFFKAFTSCSIVVHSSETFFFVFFCRAHSSLARWTPKKNLQAVKTLPTAVHMKNRR